MSNLPLIYMAGSFESSMHITTVTKYCLYVAKSQTWLSNWTELNWTEHKIVLGSRLRFQRSIIFTGTFKSNLRQAWLSKIQKRILQTFKDSRYCRLSRILISYSLFSKCPVNFQILRKRWYCLRREPLISCNPLSNIRGNYFCKLKKRKLRSRMEMMPYCGFAANIW